MKIAQKLTIALLLTALVPTLIISALSYFTIRRTVWNQITNQLNSIADIEQHRVVSILDQNKEKLALFASRQQLRRETDNYLKTNSADSLAKVNAILSETTNDISSFKNILIASNDGLVIAATNNMLVGQNISSEEYFLRGKQGNDTSIFFKDANNQLHVYLAGPLNYENQQIGVVIIDSNTDGFISVVSDYTGLGQTGEVILGKRDQSGNAVILLPLRYDQNASLNKIIRKDEIDKPITLALQRKEGIFPDTIDYRNQHVIAATRIIDPYDWGLVVKIDKNEAYAPIGQLEDYLLLSFFISLLFTAIIAFFFGRSLTKPVVELTKLAKKLRRGDFSQKAVVRSKDEVGLLAVTFNEMSDKLVEEYDKLEYKVRQKTRELHRKVLELKKINKILREMEQRKDEFISVASHELKTPLTSIMGYTQILKQQSVKDPSNTPYFLERMESQLQKITGLVNELLDVSRIQTGKLQTHIESFDLVKLIEEVIDNVRHSTNSHDISYTGKDSLLIDADRDRMNQVLTNLLSNAIKYSPAKSKIVLSAQENKDNVIVSVKDEGIGVPEEKQEKIFDRFYRARTAGDTSGLGIGLYISSEIIKAHGGSIGVKSEENKGSVFYFTLPIHKRMKFRNIRPNDETVRSQSKT